MFDEYIVITLKNNDQNNEVTASIVKWREV